MTTIRDGIKEALSDLSAILLRHSVKAHPNQGGWCEHCGVKWPCADRTEAVAAQSKLNDALSQLDGCITPGRWWANGQGVMSADYRCRVVPDPAPGDPDPWGVS